MNSATGKMPPIIHAGLDESGSLTAEIPWFVMAAVFSTHPEEIKDLIRRAALHSGKKLKRERKLHGELKWHNASERIRKAVLYLLGQANVTVYSLAVRKDGRRIDDTPENYAILACELLRRCWHFTPSVALSLDRHFTSPAHIAAVNTAIHRHWPAQGVLSIVHVDSERSPLVQLADFVAGSVYDWHKVGDPTVDLIQAKMKIAAIEDWRQIKARWMVATQKKNGTPGLARSDCSSGRVDEPPSCFARTYVPLLLDYGTNRLVRQIWRIDDAIHPWHNSGVDHPTPSPLPRRSAPPQRGHPLPGVRP